MVSSAQTFLAFAYMIIPVLPPWILSLQAVPRRVYQFGKKERGRDTVWQQQCRFSAPWDPHEVDDGVRDIWGPQEDPFVLSLENDDDLQQGGKNYRCLMRALRF